jgi:GNAT superfamily N-acetyltransferase
MPVPFYGLKWCNPILKNVMDSTGARPLVTATHPVRPMQRWMIEFRREPAQGGCAHGVTAVYLSRIVQIAMNVRSLAYRTDMIFIAFDGVILDRGDYLVLRSPRNPAFYWGNHLLFAAPPRAGDFDRWRGLFEREIGRPPEVKHQAFGWDSPEGETGLVEPFVEAGFSVERAVVLSMEELRPPARSSTAVSVRRLISDSDWTDALELQVLCREPEHAEAGFREYRRAAIDRYRRMEAAGLGHWYGAFVGDRLVADLGVFHDGKGLGRYQSVETHPEFRRQGIAGTLVYEAGRQALSQHRLRTLVMVAEDDSAPARLYQSVGFKPVEKSVGLLWWEGKQKDTVGA